MTGERDLPGLPCGVVPPAADGPVPADQQAAPVHARSLIEACLDPLLAVGTDGRITDVNAAAERITGLGRARLIGSDFANHVTEAAQARALRRTALDTGMAYDVRLGLRHVSGTVTPVLCNASLYHGPQGEVVGVLVVGREISRLLARAEIPLPRRSDCSMIASMAVTLLVLVGVSLAVAVAAAFFHERQAQSAILRTVATNSRIRTLLWELGPPPARVVAAAWRDGDDPADSIRAPTIAYGLAEPGHALTSMGQYVPVAMLLGKLPLLQSGNCAQDMQPSASDSDLARVITCPIIAPRSGRLLGVLMAEWDRDDAIPVDFANDVAAARRTAADIGGIWSP